MYRIQRRSRAKPKVVHRDRLWNNCGEEHADWFKGPVTRARVYLEEHLHNRRTGIAKLREVCSSHIPKGGKRYL